MTPMAEQILEMVTDRRGVTFAELEQIDGFSGGDLALMLGENIFMWTGLTEKAADAIGELRDLKQIHPVPTSVMTYAIDGKMLNLPLAKARRAYKTPHWIPVVFNPGSGADQK